MYLVATFTCPHQLNQPTSYVSQLKAQAQYVGKVAYGLISLKLGRNLTGRTIVNTSVPSSKRELQASPIANCVVDFDRTSTVLCRLIYPS